jgi:hypothetical protein
MLCCRWRSEFGRIRRRKGGQESGIKTERNGTKDPFDMGAACRGSAFATPLRTVVCTALLVARIWVPRAARRYRYEARREHQRTRGEATRDTHWRQTAF